MLILARASQDVVVAALAGVPADVGPTSGSGLTAVWCGGHVPIGALTGVAGIVALWDEPDAGHVVLHVHDGGRGHELVWASAGDEEPPSHAARTDLAGALARLLDGPVPETLVDDLAGVRCPDDVTDLLDASFDLPDLDPVRRRAVVVHRGETAQARTAARVATAEGLEVSLWAGAGAGSQWTVLRAADPAATEAVTHVVSAGVSRRSLVLHLWRGDGAAAGFEVVHRGHVVAEGRWDDGWRRTVGDGWESRDLAAALLARRVGSDVDLPALRSLLRSRTRSGDPLARLAELLGLPAQVLELLDGSDDVPGVQSVPPAGLPRILWEGVRERVVEPVGPRWVQVLLAGVAAVACVASAVLLTLGVAVVVTNGAFVDQVGVTVEDWVLLPVALVGVAVNARATHRLVRHGQLL